MLKGDVSSVPSVSACKQVVVCEKSMVVFDCYLAIDNERSNAQKIPLCR